MEDTMDKDAATVLEEAADLLLIHGRCRHLLEDSDGAMCALGAMNRAAFGSPHASVTHVPSVNRVAYIEAYSALTDRVGTIPSWNNDGSTTDDEVRDAMLLAAKNIRNAS